ncbi:hypothetical protein [Aurantimonas coralicida]|uniref:hypothetical protein n=1 Tax=Aurantimonas coralicida TaxID=182270 RepID=UPI0023862BB4|nr:hypothetical protein [Aurantimonas coralicida]MDE0921503.1 hypothetical protein [Aurantimonas coralicida]
MGIDIQRYRPPGPIGANFLQARGPVDIIMGPAGSGKTVASVFKGPLLATRYMPVCKDGWVRVKIACIRTTYRDFARTALASWHEAFPENHPWTVDYSGGQDRPVRHRLQWETLRGSEKVKVDLQLETGAIGDQSIEQFIKGYEISLGWMNECDALDERVAGLFLQRTGRYPPVSQIAESELDRVSKDSEAAFKLMGLTPTPGEVILPRMIWGDMNPPDISNWTLRFTGYAKKAEQLPGYVLHSQPSGLSSQAENRAGKPRSSYEMEAQTMTENDVRRFVHGKPGYATDGKAVYPEFDIDRHRADQVLQPVRGLPIGLGLDAGGSPACGIGQFLPNGQMRMLREICTDPGTGPTRFAQMILEVLLADFPGFPVNEAWADPSAYYGADRQAGELAHMEIVARALNISIMPAPSNEPGLRHDAVRWYLSGMIDGNTPRLLVSNGCEVTTGGFAAHYKLTKQASAGATDRLAVAKNEYSHIQDAWQYLCLGHRTRAGMISDAAQSGRPGKVVPISSRRARSDFDVFSV